ncbi:sirohydrochlorin chelatase [Kitasatospora sp. GP82]|uniref:sirohydrochlorin chelatase n=1 Tax=Kitasatospora sp. GP82 TaxID=3035089 RepID=UPI002472F158|nr:sirohydrochlorin chelatase [Kitasatospora sp. GP82]MDH6127376.1 sirohydrochlorin ferrochelatase [Kitasatospora sp. GP82]
MTTGARADRPPTLLAVAHGTRDPDGAAAYRALAEAVCALRPGLRVELAYLDLLRPSLDEALAGLHGPVVLVPLLLGTGYHVRVDIPAALAATPHLPAVVAPALGPDPLLAVALAERLTEAGWSAAQGGTVVLAAAGSTDPSANADTAHMAELLAGELGRPVIPSYLCASTPAPAEAVAALHAAGHQQVAVARYLLTPGYFARQAARTDSALTSAPLGAHEAIARLVLQRYDHMSCAARPPRPATADPAGYAGRSTAAPAAGPSLAASTSS